MNIFIGGSKNVSEIDDNVKEKLLQMIKNGNEILIGDCRGADAAVQHFLRIKNMIMLPFMQQTALCGIISGNLM